MTSARSMRRTTGLTARALLVALSAALSGCGARFADPSTIVSPLGGARLWGVAPFANESGTSVVDTPQIADSFMQEAQQVEGIDVIPVNRVIRAMRDLGLEQITSPADAGTVMNVLDLDALVVGTVTAYDPYRPMTLGLAVQLYARPPAGRRGELDSRTLTHSTGFAAAPGAFGPAPPVASAAGVFDAANHRTLRQLTEYAVGRTEPSDPAGLDLYLLSMDWYAQFVCYRLLHDLLLVEPIGPDPVADSSPVNR